MQWTQEGPKVAIGVASKSPFHNRKLSRNHLCGHRTHDRTDFEKETKSLALTTRVQSLTFWGGLSGPLLHSLQEIAIAPECCPFVNTDRGRSEQTRVQSNGSLRRHAPAWRRRLCQGSPVKGRGWCGVAVSACPCNAMPKEVLACMHTNEDKREIYRERCVLALLPSPMAGQSSPKMSCCVNALSLGGPSMVLYSSGARGWEATCCEERPVKSNMGGRSRAPQVRVGEPRGGVTRKTCPGSPARHPSG